MPITINFADFDSITCEEITSVATVEELVAAVTEQLAAQIDTAEQLTTTAITYPIGYRRSFPQGITGDFIVVAEDKDRSLIEFNISDGEELVSIDSKDELVQHGLFQNPPRIAWLRKHLSEKAKYALWMGEDSELFLSDSEIVNLTQALRGNTNIKRLTLKEFTKDCTLKVIRDLLYCIKTQTQIKELILEDLHLAKMGPILQEFLQQNTTLTSLVLGNSLLKNQDLSVLAAGLQSNSTLQVLSITQRHKDTFTKGLQTLHTCLEQNKCLNFFFLADLQESELPIIQKVHQITHSNSKLKELMLLQIITLVTGSGFVPAISQILLDYLDVNINVKQPKNFYQRIFDIQFPLFFESSAKPKLKRLREEKEKNKGQDKRLKPDTDSSVFQKLGYS